MYRFLKVNSMGGPLTVTLKKIEGEYALCADGDGHEFYFPTDLLPDSTEGSIVCLNIMRPEEHEAEKNFRAHEVLNTILREQIP